MNVVSRFLGGAASDLAAGLRGMRGRLWVLQVLLLLEGVFCLLVGVVHDYLLATVGVTKTTKITRNGCCQLERQQGVGTFSCCVHAEGLSYAMQAQHVICGTARIVKRCSACWWVWCTTTCWPQ